MQRVDERSVHDGDAFLRDSILPKSLMTRTARSMRTCGQACARARARRLESPQSSSRRSVAVLATGPACGCVRRPRSASRHVRLTRLTLKKLSLSETKETSTTNRSTCHNGPEIQGSEPTAQARGRRVQ